MAQEYVTLPLKGKDYIFRALDLDQLEELEPQFMVLLEQGEAGTVPTKDVVQAVAKIATASLQDQHAGITVEQVRKLLTIGTLEQVVFAIRGVSQIKPAEAGTGEA